MSLRSRWKADLPIWATTVQKFCAVFGPCFTIMLAYGATNSLTLPMWIGIAGTVIAGVGALAAQFTVKKEDKDVK